MDGFKYRRRSTISEATPQLDPYEPLEAGDSRWYDFSHVRRNSGDIAQWVAQQIEIFSRANKFTQLGIAGHRGPGQQPSYSLVLAGATGGQNLSGFAATTTNWNLFRNSSSDGWQGVQIPTSFIGQSHRPGSTSLSSSSGHLFTPRRCRLDGCRIRPAGARHLWSRQCSKGRQSWSRGSGRPTLSRLRRGGWFDGAIGTTTTC